MPAPTRQEFEDNLRRWFQTEAVGDAEVSRLWDAWQALWADQTRLAGFERMLRPENQPSAAAGAAWWEERQRGSSAPVMPLDNTARMNVWLTADATLKPPPPRPRPHRPAELVGSWRLVARTGADDRTVEPVAAGHEWTLGADGSVRAAGDPAHDGREWRKAHQRGIALLVFHAPGADDERLRIHRVTADTLELTPRGQSGGFHRFARVGP